MARGTGATATRGKRGANAKNEVKGSQLAVVNNEDQERELELEVYHKIMGIRSIVDQRNLIKFDLAIQRNEVWKETKDVHQQSLLIDSVLRKYPIGQVFVIQMGDEFMWMADGKQRWTTIFKYIDNKFPLAKGIRAVKAKDPATGESKMYDIEGKFFKDLDKVLQNKILNYEMDVKFLTNATPAEIEEIFLRLNNGTPLTKIELTRVELGEVNMIKIAEISEKRFFKTMSFISEGSRNRFIDHEMILQTLMIIMGRDSGISGNEIRQFAKAIKANGLTDEVMKIMNGIADYLADAFEQYVTINKEKGIEEMPLLNKMLKKVNVPIIFATAVEAIYKEEKELEPEVFGLWVKTFFLDKKATKDYRDATAGGSAKKDQVNTRLREMKRDFKKNIESVQEQWEATADIREQIKHEKEEAEAEALKQEPLKQGNEEGKNEDGQDNGDNNPNHPSDDVPSSDKGDVQEEHDTPPSDEENGEEDKETSGDKGDEVSSQNQENPDGGSSETETPPSEDGDNDNEKTPDVVENPEENPKEEE